jgi:hypothetical protein
MSGHTHMDSPAQNMLPCIPAVASLRARLWDAGFRPVSVYNPDSRRTHSPGKAPRGEDWTDRNRSNPPRDAEEAPHPDALNTGILCDGLRAIDIDIDNPTIAHSVRSQALSRFGECPMRTRPGSARCLLLYRAAEGQPPKRSVSGTFGKVEILGRGQQFVAFGGHPTGTQLEWMPEAPGDMPLDDLTPISEDDLTAFLAAAAESIGAQPEAKRTDTLAHQSSGLGLRADTLQVLTALASIPNTGPSDWEWWNKIGMAIWAATNGSTAGLAAFLSWSETHAAYDATETERRWNHYRTSPPTQIGAGTLFHLAKQTRAEQKQEEAPSDRGEKSKIPVVYYDEITPAIDAADFVEGLLIRNSMSVVYGQSNSGKTFWVSDMALHIAAGRHWNGKEVEQGGVLWLAMEGAMGIKNRVSAWKAHYGITDAIPFAVVPVALNLLNPDTDTYPLIELVGQVAARMGIPVSLVVVDTLSRAMAGGNENSPEDMGALVTNGTKIQQKTAAAVLWIHHSGKDEMKGARGHSLLRAATDTEIEITAEGQQRQARVTKQREMDCSGEFSFTLRVVELGQNRRGKMVTSCVVEGSGEGHTAGAVPTSKLKGHVRRALDVLHDLLSESGRAGHPGVPDGLPSVPEDWWRQRFYERTIGDGKEDLSQNGKRMAFNRSVQELMDKRLVGVNKGRVWNSRTRNTGTVN